MSASIGSRSCQQCGHRTRNEEGVCKGCLDRDTEYGYLETRAFRQYRALVEDVIFTASEAFAPEREGDKFAGLCTREIHAALGANIHRSWTIDALIGLKSVEQLPGLVDRWRPMIGADRTQRLPKGLSITTCGNQTIAPQTLETLVSTFHAAADSQPPTADTKPATASIIAAGSGRLFNRSEISELIRERNRTIQRQYRSSAPTVKTRSHA